MSSPPRSDKIRATELPTVPKPRIATFMLPPFAANEVGTVSVSDKLATGFI
jgi:hypothetical protein